MAAPTPALRDALSREAQLLALSARNTQDAGVSRQLAPNLNWPRVLYLAQRERATAILWQRLLQTAVAQVPRDLAAQWQKLAMVSEFHMAQLERLLRDALDLLARKGIDVLLLKGSALAYTAYGSFAERPMGDLDLLVRPEQAEEAWTLLQGRGWTWPSAQWPRARYATHQHLPPLASSRGGDAILEVHAELLPGGHPFDWPVDTVWAAARRLRMGGREIAVPHPLHQLLHVCLHFAWSHEMQWGAWRMLRDVEVLARRGDLAWPRFVQLARETRAATCCFWTLRLARNLVAAAIPDDVLQALRPPRPEFVLKRLEYHYLRHLFAAERTCPSKMLSNALWELGIAPGWSRHGSARPWHASERWTETTRRPLTAAGWSRRFLDRARHAALAIRYLGSITAISGRLPRPASASATTPSAP